MFVEQFVVVMLPVDVWFVLYVVESFVVAVVPEEETGAVDWLPRAVVFPDPRSSSWEPFVLALLDWRLAVEQLVLSSGAAVVVTDEVAVQRTGEAEVAEAKVAPNSFHQLPCLHSNIDPML
jgi:hypothetical protein